MKRFIELKGVNMASQPNKGAPVSFNHILIAIDRGAPSEWAVDVGGSLALQLGASVGLLHVIDLARGLSPELGIVDGRILDELRTNGIEALDRMERALPVGVAVTRLIREGDPSADIVAAAKEWGADLIVMGAHARGAVARFLLGSTAEAVVRRAHCPVLTVGHRPETLSTLPATRQQEQPVVPASPG
jgi:nucleotide-binding universal stress UspA family protein